MFRLLSSADTRPPISHAYAYSCQHRNWPSPGNAPFQTVGRAWPNVPLRLALLRLGALRDPKQHIDIRFSLDYSLAPRHQYRIMCTLMQIVMHYMHRDQANQQGTMNLLLPCSRWRSSLDFSHDRFGPPGCALRLGYTACGGVALYHSVARSPRHVPLARR